MALGTPFAFRQGGEPSVIAIQIPGDDSYTTGGSVLDLHDLTIDGVKPINAVLHISPQIPFPAADRIYSWDGGNKLIATVISTGAEVAAATDLSADTISLLVVYR